MIGICLPRIAASCSRILGNASCRQIAIGHSEPVVNNINFCRPQTPQNCRDSWTRDRWLARPMPGATDSEMVTRPVAKNNSLFDRPPPSSLRCTLRNSSTLASSQTYTTHITFVGFSLEISNPLRPNGLTRSFGKMASQLHRPLLHCPLARTKAQVLRLAGYCVVMYE